MGMKKQLVGVGIVVLLIYVGLGGCEEITTRSKFIGMWYQVEPPTNNSNRMTFYTNGSVKIKTHYSFDNHKDLAISWCTYEIKNGRLCMAATPGQYPPTDCIDFEFSNDDSTLTLIHPEGQRITLEKV
jgi:hypothetical protein